MNDQKINVIRENGEQVVCDVLFTFQSDETGKNYIVYTDNSLDEEENTKVFASIYDPTGADTRLMEIETEEEWAMIEHMLLTLQQEVLSCGGPAAAGGQFGTDSLC